MTDESYVEYLEHCVLSLLQLHGTQDVPSVNTEHPSFKGASFSPFNMVEQIGRKRGERGATELKLGQKEQLFVGVADNPDHPGIICPLPPTMTVREAEDRGDYVYRKVGDHWERA